MSRLRSPGFICLRITTQKNWKISLTFSWFAVQIMFLNVLNFFFECNTCAQKHVILLNDPSLIATKLSTIEWLTTIQRINHHEKKYVQQNCTISGLTRDNAVTHSKNQLFPPPTLRSVCVVTHALSRFLTDSHHVLSCTLKKRNGGRVRPTIPGLGFFRPQIIN